ncbi:MAG TPA: T9SS type A sorting domain-containing protein, partial [Chitinophagaceae bacterium]|nr:T9SS type A sorting domain-containing protein [Chitinophagaceae bacterium]
DTIDVAILSVNETASGQDIRIFPNPVSSVVQVRAPFPIQATLTDLSGRVLLYSKEARELDMSPFADGLYLLRITDAEGRIIGTQKLLKQKDR